MRRSVQVVFIMAVMFVAVIRDAGASVNAILTIAGGETQVSGVWDSGNITVSFSDAAGNNYTETVAYGQYSTPASIASTLGATFTRDYIAAGLCASGSGGSITFHLKSGAQFEWPTITDPSTSFAFSLSAWPPSTPSISWSTPAAIAYGTALTSIQLNASTSAPGTITYSPGPGTVLTTGPQVITAAFTPLNPSMFTQATASVTLSVTKATLSVAANDVLRTYGTANPTFTPSYVGFANGDSPSVLSGSPTFSTSATFTSPVGSYAITASVGTLTAVNYTIEPSAVNGILTVTKAIPSITWSTPSAIAYGTSLGSTQLNASAGGVSGTFTYLPPAGTNLGLGTHTLQATFTPTDQVDYDSATASVVLTVNQATPQIAWTPTTPITYGTALGAAQLNAIANTPGTFTYSPATGTVLTAGTQTLSATFTPTDTTDYIGSTQTASLAVGQATPVINWKPAPISRGMAISDSQHLNATANVAGSFSYNPPAGTVINTGTVTLTSTFTPTDAVDYQSVTMAIDITVAPSATSIINTVAGGGSQTGNGILATSAQLNMPMGVTVDAAGNFYIADFNNSRIRMVCASATSAPSWVSGCTQAGDIVTVAGTGTPGYTGDGGAATQAEMCYPYDLAIDSAGNLYIVDFDLARIRVVSTSGTIYSIAGTAAECGSESGIYSGDGVAANATLVGPRGIAVDGAANVYISDGNNIREISGRTIYTIAGTGSSGFSGDGGPATSANLQSPFGVAVDGSGNVYIADMGNYRVREIIHSSGTIYTIAGSAEQGLSGDSGPATSAELNSPDRVSVDSVGNVYVADMSNNDVRKITAPVATGTISTVVGTGTAGFTGDGGPAANAEIDYPEGLTVNSSGMLYVSDTENARIRTVTPGLAGPSINWPDPVAIVYGTPLSSAQLNATANIPGTFTYNPTAGTVLSAGNQSLTVTFTPQDTIDYDTATATVTLTVSKALPVITWSQIGPIVSGTPLSSTQLDASSSVPGTISYAANPGNTQISVGSTLPVGPHTLTATFTPNDQNDYAIATYSNYLTVTQATGTWDSGTVVLTVNGSQVSSAQYGRGTTASMLAAVLQSGVQSSSPVSVTAVGDSLYVEAKSGGAGSDYSYSLATTSYDSQDFSEPSFMSPPAEGNLDGGVTTIGTPTTVYSYAVPSGGYDEVSNLVNYTDSVMGTWGFSYDSLNRLATATDNQPNNPFTNYCWSYDSFGNRTIQAGSSQPFAVGSDPSSGSACQPAQNAAYTSAWASFSPSANQMLATNQAQGGISYDAAGNITYDGINYYLYDGDSRICAVASVLMPGVMTGYVYGADGERVAKGSITTWSCDPSVSGFSVTNDYVLGLGGEQVTEEAMDGNGNMAWQHTNIWAAGKLIGTYDNDGLHFYLDDPLGTRRVQTDYAGVIEQACSSLPFGDALNCTNSTHYPTEHHFTGKERDTESGNDYFGARYYASTMGRFLSPDWSAKEEPVPYAKLDNPQTLNLYNYMRNNPLAGVDSDGHCCEEDGEEETRENEEFERDLGEAREELGRRDAAEAEQREQRSFEQFKKENSGGYDDENGFSHVGPPTRQEFERQQAENREKLEKGDVAGALGKGGAKPPTEDQAGKGVQRGGKDRSQAGTVDQLKDISKNQRNLRKAGKGEAIRSIKKSEQDVDNANKRIKSSKDIEE